jgi:glutamyl-Q tRNA(Asp) synthetase
VKPGAETEILRQLEAHGLWWDGPIRRQSEHVDEYEAALEHLRREGCLYACRCTRAQLARLTPVSEPQDAAEAPYPGTCREAARPDVGAALRVRLEDGADPGLGGDFVVRRRDGQIGYQLACAIDEHALGITDVVRGADLVQSGHRQRWLLERLQLDVPRYRHLPLVLAENGRKLSKTTEAAPLRDEQAAANLRFALNFLGQSPPNQDRGADVRSLLHAAVSHWTPERIPSEGQRVT